MHARQRWEKGGPRNRGISVGRSSLKIVARERRNEPAQRKGAKQAEADKGGQQPATRWNSCHRSSLNDDLGGNSVPIRRHRDQLNCRAGIGVGAITVLPVAAGCAVWALPPPNMPEKKPPIA